MQSQFSLMFLSYTEKRIDKFQFIEQSKISAAKIPQNFSVMIYKLGSKAALTPK